MAEGAGALPVFGGEDALPLQAGASPGPYAAPFSQTRLQSPSSSSRRKRARTAAAEEEADSEAAAALSAFAQHASALRSVLRKVPTHVASAHLAGLLSASGAAGTDAVCALAREEAAAFESRVLRAWQTEREQRNSARSLEAYIGGDGLPQFHADETYAEEMERHAPLCVAVLSALAGPRTDERRRSAVIGTFDALLRCKLRGAKNAALCELSVRRSMEMRAHGLSNAGLDVQAKHGRGLCKGSVDKLYRRAEERFDARGGRSVRQAIADQAASVLRRGATPAPQHPPPATAGHEPSDVG